MKNLVYLGSERSYAQITQPLVDLSGNSQLAVLAYGLIGGEPTSNYVIIVRLRRSRGCFMIASALSNPEQSDFKVKAGTSISPDLKDGG